MTCGKDLPQPRGNLDLSIVCFDFDGVLAKDVWPSPLLGEPIVEGVEALMHYARTGWAIVIYSARPESHEARIWQWVQQYGLGAYVYEVKCGKPSAAAYIDDKAIRFPFNGEEPVVVHQPEEEKDWVSETLRAAKPKKRKKAA